MMRKMLITLSTSLLLYCFLAGAAPVWGECAAVASTQAAAQLGEEEGKLSDAQIGLFFHSSHSLYAQAQSPQAAQRGSKKSPSSFGVILQTYEAVCSSAFYQYKHSTQPLIVRFRKSDLIFPFHYFW